MSREYQKEQHLIKQINEMLESEMTQREVEEELGLQAIVRFILDELDLGFCMLIRLAVWARGGLSAIDVLSADFAADGGICNTFKRTYFRQKKRVDKGGKPWYNTKALGSAINIAE